MREYTKTFFVTSCKVMVMSHYQDSQLLHTFSFTKLPIAVVCYVLWMQTGFWSNHRDWTASHALI